MSYITAFSSSYLNLDEIKLGELVLYINDPNKEFCIHFPILTKSDYACRPFCEVGGSNKDERASSFSAMLTKLFTFGAHWNQMEDETIRAKQANTYSLKNHEPCLERQLKNKETMDWVLTQKRENKDIYMIIGYHTVVEAEVNNNHRLNNQMEVRATVPLSEAALPGSSNTPIGQAMDVSLDAKGSHKYDQAISFLAPGERIIGIRYRKLRLVKVKSDTVNGSIGSKHRASDNVDSSFKITLKDKDKWTFFTARNSGHVAEKPVKDLSDEVDTGINISCSFADMSEDDLHDIMNAEYDLESDQYQIGVFPRTMGGQEAAAQEAVARGDKLVVEDEGHEKHLWVFIDDKRRV